MKDEHREYLKWLTETTNKYRGEFANQAIVIEQIIEEFLSHYFISDVKEEEKRLHFHQLILGSIDVTFSQKINMISEIGKKFLPSNFDKYKPLFSKIDKLRKKRNEFAHSKIDGQEKTILLHYQERDKLYLLKLDKYKIKQTVFEISILENLLKDYWDITVELNAMLNEYLVFIKALPSDISTK